jgi:hypothetical protein
MAEFLSQDEIDELLDIAEQGESINLDYELKDITTVKYDLDSKTFYKHNKGFKTEDEAKFRAVKEKLTLFNNNIIDYTNYIEQYKKVVDCEIIKRDELINEYSDSLIQFSEEMLI